MKKEEAMELIKEAYGNSEMTDEIIKALGQEPILDKIRAEIEEYKSRQLAFAMAIDIADLEKGKQVALDYVLAIFDEYKAESEE